MAKIILKFHNDALKELSKADDFNDSDRSASEDDGLEAFADELADDLSNHLSQVTGLSDKKCQVTVEVKYSRKRKKK